MSDAGKCKKRSRKRDRAVCEEMTRRRRVKRIEREAKRQSACKAVRALSEQNEPDRKLWRHRGQDISRRVRKAAA